MPARRLMPRVWSMILIFKLRYLFHILLNFISHSPDSLDQLLMSHHLSELFSQMADVDHNCIVVVLEILFFPYLLKEIF